MSQTNDLPLPRTSLAEVKAAAEDLLSKIARADLTETDLFPHGITQLSVVVRAGDIEVNVNLSGPDYPHTHMGEDEWDEEDLYEEEDDDDDEDDDD